MSQNTTTTTCTGTAQACTCKFEWTLGDFGEMIQEMVKQTKVIEDFLLANPEDEYFTRGEEILGGVLLITLFLEPKGEEYVFPLLSATLREMELFCEYIESKREPEPEPEPKPEERLVFYKDRWMTAGQANQIDLEELRDYCYDEEDFDPNLECEAEYLEELEAQNLPVFVLAPPPAKNELEMLVDGPWELSEKQIEERDAHLRARRARLQAKRDAERQLEETDSEEEPEEDEEDEEEPETPRSKEEERFLDMFFEAGGRICELTCFLETLEPEDPRAKDAERIRDTVDTFFAMMVGIPNGTFVLGLEEALIEATSFLLDNGVKLRAEPTPRTETP